MMKNKVLVKICGINDSTSAKACVNVDYVGLVFYQKSSRFITAFQAKKISTFLPKSSNEIAKAVVVFPVPGGP